MSEPDNPRWLERLSGELRHEVPVRAAWRARLLDDVSRSPRPVAGSGEDVVDNAPDTDDISRAHGARIDWRARRLVMHPLAGLAAGLAFAAAGAAATLAVLSARNRDADGSPPRVAAKPAADAAITPTAADSRADAAIVRFELSAPTATQVTLVGSFNRWNPVATPLERDPASGRWMVSIRLPAGRHVYAFVVDGDVTADPAAPRAADADFGAPNSVVLVSGRSL